jgi:competence protein ComEC
MIRKWVNFFTALGKRCWHPKNATHHRRLTMDKTMLRQVYARPIIPLLISLISGIVLGCYLPGHTIAMLVIGIFVSGRIAINIIYQKAAGLTPLVLLFALGYLSLQPWISPKFPPNHIQHFSDETPWQIVGVVDSEPFGPRTIRKFVLRAETITDQTASHAVTGKIRVSVRGQSPDLAMGDRVTFRSRLRSIHNFNNPGGFDFQQYMAFKGLYRTAYTSGGRLGIIQKNLSKDPAQLLNDARRAMAALIDRAGSDPAAGVLKALVIGDRTAVPLKIRDAFNRAGVGHILAISGLHIGIVATVAFVFFKKLLSAIKFLLWRAWTRKGAAILTLIPVCIYGLLSGMSPSTQRAVIMVTAFLITFLVERERDAMNTLALAALVILVAYPPSLFSISFQLSFLAVLSILYGLSRIQQTPLRVAANTRSGIGFQLTRKITAFLLISVFAIGGTLPLVMFYFNQMSVIGIFANFVVVPLVGFIVIPLGLLALFLYPISSQLAFGCVQICLFVLDNVLAIVRFFADLPFAAFKTITPNVFEMACFYMLGWALLNTVTAEPDAGQSQGADHGRSDHAPSPAGYSRSGRRRRLSRIYFFMQTTIRDIAAWPIRKRGAIVGLLVILALAGDVSYWLYQRFWQDDLRVTIIDVGQGSAALLELPGGYTTLIDGGGFSDNAIFDMGARVIAPFLWRKKIKTIDTLVLSHPNSDHLNGLIFIAQHFNIKNIWTNNEAKATLGYRLLPKSICTCRISNICLAGSRSATSSFFSCIRLPIF